MARPQAEILLEYIDKKTRKATQILAAEAVWAVFYLGKPINLKELLAPYLPKNSSYPKSAFGNRAHAVNLAKKFNKMFNTTDFTVVKLTSGDTV